MNKKAILSSILAVGAILIISAFGIHHVFGGQTTHQGMLPPNAVIGYRGSEHLETSDVGNKMKDDASRQVHITENNIDWNNPIKSNGKLYYYKKGLGTAQRNEIAQGETQILPTESKLVFLHKNHLKSKDISNMPEYLAVKKTKFKSSSIDWNHPLVTSGKTTKNYYFLKNVNNWTRNTFYNT